MMRFMSVAWLLALIGLAALPCQALAASITETKAAIGEYCFANGDNATAMGYHAIANGKRSIAMGYYTLASGDNSTAMGQYTIAEGGSSTSMGAGCVAKGFASASIGAQNYAGGDFSFAGGSNMNLSRTSHNTFVWGSADRTQALSIPNAFLIFPAGTPGRVGIGTPTPTAKLDIRGESDSIVLSRLNQTGKRNWSGWRIDRDSSETWFVGVSNVNDNLLFRRTTSSDDMVISEAGNVGIGGAPTLYKLEVKGDALKTAGGNTWKTNSDERLKDITGEYARGLNEIVRLAPVTFYYKEDNPRGLSSEEESVGFIAQEVQEVFPEAVSKGPDGYLDFNMHPVNVALVNAVKELKAENEALREEIRVIKAALGM